MKGHKLFVALDFDWRETASEWADKFSKIEAEFGFKLNQDMITHHGTEIVKRLVTEFGRPVFADMKMWNGGRTMASTIGHLAEAGAAITNVYCQAGVKLLKKALKAAEGSQLQVFGVGVLTHYTDEYCKSLYHLPMDRVVRDLGAIAIEAGLHGYILPGTTLEYNLDMKIPKLVPAVRPAWFVDLHANDQEQTVTPEYAMRNGANYVVCGSPIFKSPDPIDALNRILDEIQ